MEYVALGLAILSLILHFVAPKTASKMDDELAEVVDAVKDAIPASPAK